MCVCACECVRHVAKYTTVISKKESKNVGRTFFRSHCVCMCVCLCVRGPGFTSPQSVTVLALRPRRMKETKYKDKTSE